MPRAQCIPPSGQWRGDIGLGELDTLHENKNETKMYKYKSVQTVLENIPICFLAES